MLLIAWLIALHNMYCVRPVDIMQQKKKLLLYLCNVYSGYMVQICTHTEEDKKKTAYDMTMNI